MDKPDWWKCVSSEDPRFTPGVAYEVLEYDEHGTAIIVSDNGRSCYPITGCAAAFKPHDPWASYKRSENDGHG